MWKLYHDWRLLALLVVELVGLEKIVVVKAVAVVFIQILFGRKNQYFLVWSILLRLPECQEVLVIGSFRLYLLFFLACWLLPLELHVQKYLSQIKMDAINVLLCALEFSVLIRRLELVDCVKVEMPQLVGVDVSLVICSWHIHQAMYQLENELLLLARDGDESKVMG